MNKWVVNFLKIGLAVAKAQVPAIAVVETAVIDLKKSTKDKTPEEKKLINEAKKNAVLDMVKASPEIYEMIANKEIINEQLFAEGIAQANDAYVKIMNSMRKPGEAPTVVNPIVP